MKYRSIGSIEVSSIGLGLMAFHTPHERPYRDLVAAVKSAFDAGITLFDSADCYGPLYVRGEVSHGYNEILIRQILYDLGLTDEVVVSTKGGGIRTPDGGWSVDGRPEHLIAAVEESCQRLGVERIGLWFHHRLDDRVPFDETLDALNRIAGSGRVENLGLSNVGRARIRAAKHRLGDRLVCVQNELSPFQTAAASDACLCSQLDIAFVAYRPFGGTADSQGLRNRLPVLAQIADERDVAIQAVILAWEIALHPTMLAIPGSATAAHIQEFARGGTLDLTGDEQRTISAALGVTRCAPECEPASPEQS